MADNSVGEETMTPDRAALRQIAERFGHMEPEESDRNYAVRGLKLYDMIALCRDYLDRTAPLLVKCRECGGTGKLSNVVDASSYRQVTYSMTCLACHGKGSVEREDIAAIRKRAEAATPGPWRSLRDGNQYIKTDYIPTAECVGTSRVEGIVRPWNPHAVMAFKKFDEAHVARFLDADADFIANARTDIPFLLDLIAAQAREIAELKGKANGTL